MNALSLQPLLPEDRRGRPDGKRIVESPAARARRAQRLADAIDTMMRGTAFLHAHAASLEERGASSVARHAMVLANALRELDRFLHVLLNELAARAGLSGPELRSFRRQRNAAAKLSAYPALLGGQLDDQGLLRRLATQKVMLRRLFSGRRRTDGGEAAIAARALIDLRTISAYYTDLSVRLIGHAGASQDARCAVN